MSVAPGTSAPAPGTSAPTTGSSAPVAGSGQEPVVASSTPAVEACPLCRTPLRPEQEWCLACGAAARTRLAATPNWSAPIVALAAVAVLSLAALAVALVALAGGS